MSTSSVTSKRKQFLCPCSSVSPRAPIKATKTMLILLFLVSTERVPIVSRVSSAARTSSTARTTSTTTASCTRDQTAATAELSSFPQQCPSSSKRSAAARGGHLPSPRQLRSGATQSTRCHGGSTAGYLKGDASDFATHPRDLSALRLPWSLDLRLGSAYLVVYVWGRQDETCSKPRLPRRSASSQLGAEQGKVTNPPASQIGMRLATSFKEMRSRPQSNNQAKAMQRKKQLLVCCSCVMIRGRSCKFTILEELLEASCFIMILCYLIC